MRPEALFFAFGALILLFLSLIEAAALLPSCGLRLGSSEYLDFCHTAPSQGPSPELAAELERRAALEERLRGLERDLAGLPACRPEPAPKSDRLDANRWQERDLALLEGCWSLASDYRLRDSRSGEVTGVDSWTMCFYEDGRGEQRLVQNDGAACDGEVSASFDDDGQLRISDDGDVQCTGGVVIYRRVMTCDLERNGEAACRSRQPNRGDGFSNVRIVRRESS